MLLTNLLFDLIIYSHLIFDAKLKIKHWLIFDQNYQYNFINWFTD